MAETINGYYCNKSSLDVSQNIWYMESDNNVSEFSSKPEKKHVLVNTTALTMTTIYYKHDETELITGMEIAIDLAIFDQCHNIVLSAIKITHDDNIEIRESISIMCTPRGNVQN